MLRHDRDDMRRRIRANCEACAGIERICPLLAGCEFIPITHLRKARRVA
jgi:hypothetical protein